MSDAQDAAQRVRATTSRLDALINRFHEEERRRLEDDRSNQEQD